ncbi:TPA: AraC family transcriptional regulator N-terminal domain-containing protein [Citrobacter freundii]|nr:AraC family transcriptional regulator N-terminal domain-containing protein [Citrobacter freundii]EKY0659095.1 AraC family transcriptional regulator N-terminal domain-containing protein [Citrobacter freundii]ELQ7797792.1 AraC family transcriptional regulator N-terminal domain-containing protein [Citrobacter freundii]ELT9543078.1 AraC family transcriptional regulator N-terminal domain-containing protein [Citrobacter freundii]MBE0097921.1 AraC family transcriptional regulator [Citrobacter freun
MATCYHSLNAKITKLQELALATDNQRTETCISRVAMVLRVIPEHRLSAVYEPMINMVLTGSKRMMIDDRTLQYYSAQNS